MAFSTSTRVGEGFLQTSLPGKSFITISVNRISKVFGRYFYSHSMGWTESLSEETKVRVWGFLDSRSVKTSHYVDTDREYRREPENQRTEVALSLIHRDFSCLFKYDSRGMF